MNWDQIESKWAAMASRIRGASSRNAGEATAEVQDPVADVDASTSNGADQQTTGTRDLETATSTL